MFGSFVEVSKIRQKSWFSGNGSALRAVICETSTVAIINRL